MAKYKLSFALLVLAAPVFAGLIDHGDHTGFPNVNVDAHLVKIAKFHYPELRENLPQGMPRAEAWRHDITEAAKDLNVPADRLEPFIDYVVNYHKVAPVAAPHEKLLEFELYAQGRNELFEWKSTARMPPAWRRLFALPVERRRYATIPVLYAWNKFRAYRVDGADLEDALGTIAASRKLGCFDTQGCERSILGREPQWCDPDRKIRYYNRLFRAYAVKCVPNKPWRHINAYDRFLYAEFRGDAFYSGEAMPNLRYSLYCENERTLRMLCRNSPALRDLIVAVGLTNYRMYAVRKVAKEFAYQSEINYPILALRVPYLEAEKLLADKPEHAALLEQLRLKRLSGTAKVRAIDAYVFKYPDYTWKDMATTSVALNTHGELQALAGLELFRLGRPREALERWMICGTPEDIGIVAEQLFTIDELIDFCNGYDDSRIRDADLHVYSSQCAKYDDPVQAPIFSLLPDGSVHILRNILARRLMRAGRFEEAQRYFTGWRNRSDMAAFMRFRAVLDDPGASRADKLAASLSLAMLIRFRGDALFGTFLEPDNVICHGRFACEWGKRVTHMKLDKPALPRFHYRWIAAEYYRKSAEYTDDPKLKGFCFWMAGTLLKNRDPKLAEKDFRKMAAVRPELVLAGANWFMPLSKCPRDVRELYRRCFFVADANQVDTFLLPLPPVEKAELPPHDGSADALLSLGKKIGGELVDLCPAEPAFAKKARQALYAFRLAGEMGAAEGYAECGTVYVALDQPLCAVACFRKALTLDSKCGLARLFLGVMYMNTGHWDAGAALLRSVADGEHADRKLAAAAAFRLGEIYAKGKYGVDADFVTAKRYLERAAASGHPSARQVLGELEELEKKRIQKLIRDLNTGGEQP